MAKTQVKSCSLAEMKDKYVGKKGTKEREQYEYKLRMNVAKIKNKSPKIRLSKQVPLTPE